MESDTLTLWQALHRGSPLAAPQPIIGGKLHTNAHQDDGNMPGPPEDVKTEPYVYYSKRRQYWCVEIKNPSGFEKSHHRKSGFEEQSDAVAYRDKVLREFGTTASEWSTLQATAKNQGRTLQCV